ncbi:MAG TPA: asparagine synthase C-terminal domain-containing protein [Candidatus Woesearchaeota archaeon]|nr:asparagine synthase C-terminal domain-containing protein [Candidatus Woesearchaeota archaeon]
MEKETHLEKENFLKQNPANTSLTKDILIDTSLTSDKWKNHIKNLKESNNLEILKIAPEKIFKLLSQKIYSSFEKNLPKKFILFFSGGIDSTLIAYLAQKFKRDFVCITIGFTGSHDIEFSKIVSKYYGFNHKIIEMNHKKLENIIPLTKQIINDSNYVKVSVGSVFVLGMKYSKSMNHYEHILTGLGSEEIFAGYQRHENAKSINEECWNGLFELYHRDLSRDIAIIDYYKKKAILPFLSKELISLAMKIPQELKIKNSIKKYCLRKAAVILGLKEEFSFEPKKAAQYGSNIDKEIEKLAKMRKVTKSEYVKTV